VADAAAVALVAAVAVATISGHDPNAFLFCLLAKALSCLCFAIACLECAVASVNTM
jgi:hypothetical protein